MDRRAFLASGVAGLGVASAGCAGLLGQTVTLSDPETRTQDEGKEQYLTYREGSERVVTLGFDQRGVMDSPTDQFGFRISVAHSDDTKIESFRFDLRAPQTSVDPPADVYLRSPAGGLWPDLTFEQVENLWTRIELGDTGELGEGTLNLHTIVDPNTAPAEGVGVRAEMTLSERGSSSSYQLDTATEFETVRAEDVRESSPA